MQFENLHYRTVGGAFPCTPVFYQSLNFHSAISYHLKRQHLLTFGYPFGYTKEKVMAIFSLNCLQYHILTEKGLSKSIIYYLTLTKMLNSSC